jgi:hypothetical protein
MFSFDYALTDEPFCIVVKGQYDKPWIVDETNLEGDTAI